MSSSNDVDHCTSHRATLHRKVAKWNQIQGIDFLGRWSAVYFMCCVAITC